MERSKSKRWDLRRKKRRRQVSPLPSLCCAFHWRFAGGMEGGDSPQEGGEERNGEKQEQAMGPKKEEEEKAGKSPPFSLPISIATCLCSIATRLCSHDPPVLTRPACAHTTRLCLMSIATCLSQSPLAYLNRHLPISIATCLCSHDPPVLTRPACALRVVGDTDQDSSSDEEESTSEQDSSEEEERGTSLPPLFMSQLASLSRLACVCRRVVPLLHLQALLPHCNRTAQTRPRLPVLPSQVLRDEV
jgi:hypothetical protein